MLGGVTGERSGPYPLKVYQGRYMDKTCDVCGGKGYSLQTDFMRATSNKVPCKNCNGSGRVPLEMKEVEDGVIFSIQKCEVGFWQEKRCGKVVSTLHIHICPVRDKDGKMLGKLKDPSNPLNKAMVPRIFIEIVNMNTKPKHRKEGIMSRLLEAAIADPKIEWAESSWDDSTGDGRNFLLGRGFVQEGSKIIYRKSVQ